MALTPSAATVRGCLAGMAGPGPWVRDRSAHLAYGAVTAAAFRVLATGSR